MAENIHVGAIAVGSVADALVVTPDIIAAKDNVIELNSYKMTKPLAQVAHFSQSPRVTSMARHGRIKRIAVTVVLAMILCGAQLEKIPPMPEIATFVVML